MLTPQQAAQIVKWPDPTRDKEIHDFVLTASARDLQLFIHNFAPSVATEWFNRAKTALEVRISIDQAESAKRLEESTGALVKVSKDILSAHHKVVWLTWALVFLTIVLLVATFVLAWIAHSTDERLREIHQQYQKTAEVPLPVPPKP